MCKLKRRITRENGSLWTVNYKQTRKDKILAKRAKSFCPRPLCLALSRKSLSNKHTWSSYVLIKSHANPHAHFRVAFRSQPHRRYVYTGRIASPDQNPKPAPLLPVRGRCQLATFITAFRGYIGRNRTEADRIGYGELGKADKLT